MTVFRLFLRDLLVALLLLALAGGAAMVLGLLALAPAPVAPWSRELDAAKADPVLLARDGALLVFALAGVGGLLRLGASGLRLLGRDYPALAHLAEVLASRLVRRAGALLGVALALFPGSGLARGWGAARTAQGVANPPRIVAILRPDATLTPITPAPLPAGARAVPRPARPARRVAYLSVGLALRYTVQPGDTLNDVAERFGLPDWRPIMWATRGLRQPVGGPITDPDLIYPGQTLHIPLPCPALRVAEGRVLYVVQQEDTLSGIAARFFGNWRAFREIGELNRGVHQPDGGALQDDNVIQPGWVLRLPQEYVLREPSGTTVTRRLVVADRRPTRLWRGVRPRRQRPRPAQATPIPLTRQKQPARHVSATRKPVPTVLRPIHAKPRHRAAATPTALTAAGDERRRRATTVPRRAIAVGRKPGIRGTPLRPRRPVTPQRPPAAPRSMPHPIGPRAPRPKQRVGHAAPDGSLRRYLVLRRRLPVRSAAAGSVLPRPVHRSGTVKPVVHVPDLGRDLPIAFIAGFLALAMAVARRRRAAQTAQQQAGGTSGGTSQGTGHLPRLAPSVQRSLRAALQGVEGRLARALRRTPSSAAGGGAQAAHVMAVLEQVSREIGLPYSLAGATRLLIEGAETIELVVEAPRLPTSRLDAAVGHLATKLGVTVSAGSSVERDGTPLVTLIIKSAALASPAEVRPHPAPLLVPLGTTSSGDVLHLHMGRTGGLLVGGGGQSLVATLLAGIIFQAPPDALRLLVASDDDELRKALPQLEHLDAPPADARDPRAVANLIAQAYTLVLERYERHGAAASATPAVPPAPCLLVLAGLENLDDEALDRLDAVAHTGPVCGVHLIATTGDVAALAANGLLAVFRTRLARRLVPEENQLLCPDADADLTPNAPHEVLLYGLGTPQKLMAFTLTPPEVCEVFATVAAATLPPLPAFVPPPASTSQPTTPSSALADAVPSGPDAHDDADAPPGADAVLDDLDEGEEQGGDTLPAPEPNPSAVTGPDGPLVRIELLGGVTIYVCDQPINILPRERSLLTALAVMGPRPVRRPDLIEALFSDETDGGNTLSHALSDLRAALRKGGLSRERAGSIVLKTGGGYYLHQDMVEVDLWQFDALLREAEGLDEADAGPVRERAFALYHGALCGGEALNFLADYSYRWMKRIGPAMYSLAEYHRDTGDLTGALHWTRRLLADEPCDDHANQLLLNLLADAGDAEGLDAHMQQMREHYAAYKLKIDAYTVRLYEQLRRKLTGEATTKAG